MPITPAGLLRAAGLSAMAARLIFAGFQPVHPPDVVSSVTGTTWGIITPFKTVRCLLMLVGVTGLYARQVTRVGWLGLSGYLIFSRAWAITYADVFAETVVLPPLSAAAPTCVDSLLGIGGRVSAVDLGAFPALFTVSGTLDLLIGAATYRACCPAGRPD